MSYIAIRTESCISICHTHTPSFQRVQNKTIGRWQTKFWAKKNLARIGQVRIVTETWVEHDDQGDWI